MTQKKEILFFRESLIQSIASDLFSYGMLFTMFWLNYTFIGGNNFVDLLLLLIFIIMSFARGNSKAQRFTSKEDLKEFVNKL
jgi:hypothetical protein